MIIRFLLSRLGLSILLAVVIIGVAIGLKHRGSETLQAKGAATLAVEKIISETIKNVNQLEQNGSLIASTSAAAASPAAENPPTVPSTATDRLSQEIFKEYIQAKQSGQEVNADISNQIADKVLSQDYSDKITLRTAADMKSSQNMSLAAIKSYGNALGSIFSTPPAAKEDELTIFQKITTQPVGEYAKELTAIKSRYQKIESKLLALAAPAELAATQADIANAIAIFIDSVTGALDIDSDPIGALNKIARYDDGITLLKRSLPSLQEFFVREGVSFTATESGSILMK